jgi:hypothetical protein
MVTFTWKKYEIRGVTMFWDYLRARLSLIIGLLIGITVFILLWITKSNPWVTVGFLPLYLILLRSFVKRVSIKTMHDFERMLYKDLRVFDYASKYEFLVQNGVKFDERWTVTKIHNAILGNIFLGEKKKARTHITHLENTYVKFYKRNSVFKYMFEVLKTLHAMFFDTPEAFKSHTKTMKKTLDNLPDNVKNQIKSNEESFHNWIQWNEKHIVRGLSVPPQNLLSTIKKMPKLNALGSYYLLKRNNQELNDEILEEYLQNAFIIDDL